MIKSKETENEKDLERSAFGLRERKKQVRKRREGTQRETNEREKRGLFSSAKARGRWTRGRAG